jgi:hypothetical protein
VLIEGPQEAESVLQYLIDPDLKPPVAILLYDLDQPKHASYYPLADFSPELQAVRWAHKQGVPVKCIDLPAENRLSIQVSLDRYSDALQTVAEATGFEDVEDWWEHLVEQRTGAASIFEAVETLMTELRSVDSTIELPEPEEDEEEEPDDRPKVQASVFEQLRESHMLGAIQKAVGEFERVAVVCGAWHVPALQTLSSEPPPDGTHATKPEELQKPTPPSSARARPAEGKWSEAESEEVGEFAELERSEISDAAKSRSGRGRGEDSSEPARSASIKTLPKCKVGTTVVPWTYELLTSSSGYGAGARSPAFYELIWKTNAKEVTRRWLLSVARLMRGEDLDASPASVIEAVRLADALAAIRERPRPGLRELSDAANAVLVRDDSIWALIGKRLIVGERLGSVPDHVPVVPLQDDLRKQQRRLRMVVEGGHRNEGSGDFSRPNDPDSDKLLQLDLRGDMDLERSHLLYRLQILDIPWGQRQVVGKKLGTFHEHWNLRWTPGLAIPVIQASVWGNTVADAATARAIDRSRSFNTLADISKLLDQTLLANLSQAIEPVLAKLKNMSATVADVADLGDALPPLAAMARYGSVRRIDTTHLEPVLEAVFTRYCIGVPGGCRSLDDDAARAMAKRLTQTASVVRLLESEEKLQLWLDALRQIAEGAGVHPLLWGKAERLRFDFGVVSASSLGDRLRFEASTASSAVHTAAFVEGLLEGPGIVLIHQEELWSALDDWVSSLKEEAFDEVLPLIRRTFALFEKHERRQLGERVAQAKPAQTKGEVDIDMERAQRVLPVIRQILGVQE